MEGASSAAEIDLRETQANRFISNIISEVFCAEGRVRMREALGTCLSPQGGLNGGSGEQGDRYLPRGPPPPASPPQKPAHHPLQGRAPGGCVSVSTLGLLPSPSQTVPVPAPQAQGGAGVGSTGSPASAPLPPTLPCWVACLPQRLFTECPASPATSGGRTRGPVLARLPHLCLPSGCPSCWGGRQDC